MSLSRAVPLDHSAPRDEREQEDVFRPNNLPADQCAEDERRRG